MDFEYSKRQQCPICQAEGLSSLCPVVLTGTEPVYNLAECAGCHTRFLNPLPTSEELSRFYAPHYYGSDWYKQEEKGRRFGRTMLPGDSIGKFLDVGCSLGFFINGIHQSSGWGVYGVEISPEAVAFAQDKLNLDVRLGELSGAGYPDQFFDYIHVNNVLEHVCNPIDFLKECRRILRPGGKLYLSVPNGPVDSASLIKYYQCEKSPVRSKDGHLFFFSEDALRKMFREADLQILSSRTYGIRRGLRALGRYPQKPGWKKPYQPQQYAGAQVQTAIQLPKRKKRLPGYYFYRFWQARLKMLPGLWSIGLDFEIIGTAPND
jgi:SAM-dependent methyltransferase